MANKRDPITGRFIKNSESKTIAKQTENKPEPVQIIIEDKEEQVKKSKIKHPRFQIALSIIEMILCMALLLLSLFTVFDFFLWHKDEEMFILSTCILVILITCFICIFMIQIDKIFIKDCKEEIKKCKAPKK